MSNQIDLSKAYTGQIVTLSNGDTDVFLKVDVLNEDRGIFEVFFKNRKNHYGFIYKNDGTRHREYSPYCEIIAIEDPIQVQAARLEGMIKGMKRANEYAVRSMPEYFEALLKDLEEQLKALQDGNN